MRNVALLAMLGFGLALCGCGDRAVSTDDDHTRLLTLPNGTKIRVEVMMRPEDMARGMMFRDSLAADRGMLFIHGSPGNYPYWMFQVKIPLDMMWLDESRKIVEISENTPPCPPGAKKCPTYGGHQRALFIVELAAGSVSRHHLRIGDTLTF